MYTAIDDQTSAIEREFVTQRIAVRVPGLVIRTDMATIDQQPIGAMPEAEIAGMRFVDQLAALRARREFNAWLAAKHSSSIGDECARCRRNSEGGVVEQGNLAVRSTDIAQEGTGVHDPPPQCRTGRHAGGDRWLPSERQHIETVSEAQRVVHRAALVVAAVGEE